MTIGTVQSMQPSIDRLHDDDADVLLRLPAVRGSVGVARQLVLGLGDHLGLDDDRGGDIAIAVSEACANSVMHAYPNEVAGQVELLAWLSPGSLVVAIRDSGAGISPRIENERAGLGLGLPLMIAIADQVLFHRDNGGIQEVRMRFEVGEGA